MWSDLKSSTVKSLLRKMNRYGHIQWLENVLRERMKAEFGREYIGSITSGPSAPTVGDMREYSINVDGDGRRFVRIPINTLKTEEGGKVVADFLAGQIVLKPTKREEEQ